MNLDEIDKSLETWQKNIQAASANISALEALPSYITLKANVAKLQGKTKNEIGVALLAMNSVWEQFTLLNHVVQEAVSLRKDLPQIFGRGDRIQKISDLLSGQSIVLQKKEIPIDERGLTGVSEREERTSPQALFDQMQMQFQAAAKANAHYDKSYLELTEKLGKAIEADDKARDKVKRPKLDAICPLIDTDPLAGLEMLALAERKPRPPSKPPVVKQEIKQEPIKTVKPAPVEPVKPAPVVAVVNQSKLVTDPRVNRMVRAETLNPLEALILNPKASSTPVKPPEHSPQLEAVLRNEQTPPSKLETLLSQEPKKVKTPDPDKSKDLKDTNTKLNNLFS